MSLEKLMVNAGRSLVGVMAFVMAGCSSTPEITETKTTLIVNTAFNPVELPAQEQLFSLPQHAIDDFLAYYNAPAQQDVKGHKRLYEYLDVMLSGFDYHHGTYDAQTAYLNRSGNCLSLAILTTALAQLVDIEVDYRQVHSSPIYKKHNNVMTLSSHVRTRLYDPDFSKAQNQVVFMRPHVVVDYFPRRGNVGASVVSREHFIAKYYQNLAGKALIERDFDKAFALLDRARKVDPNNPETLNTLGVLLRQTGDYAEAEKVYRYILENTPGSVNTIANYIVLLESTGRHEMAKELHSLTGSIEDDNPYRWFEIAESHYRNGHYRLAREYFAKSIEYGPYMNEAYFGLAKSYYMTGSHDKAKQAMQQALDLTYLTEEKILYQAKLESLENP